MVDETPWRTPEPAPEDREPPEDATPLPNGDPGDEATASEPPRRKRRKRTPPPKSPAHEARIEEYRRRVETRGWIFSPPTPEKPLSYLFDDLTVRQIVSLGLPGDQRNLRRRA
ncbi:MAG: hypothetical protein D6731_09325 [Planctomycetota bacterium]|nr:MAG: hypothetical protein D6731_09325 [Planctomycetota bacterium]